MVRNALNSLTTDRPSQSVIPTGVPASCQHAAEGSLFDLSQAQL